jgi:sortase A
MNDEEYARILDDARNYNAELADRDITWTLTDAQREDYQSQLNVDGSGIMGYIKIQKIDVMLPIYHGTDESVLQTSIGHMEESSLPVGGESAHCMLSGHRGLPSARLFTDLDKLVEGDTFTLTVLNETLTYEVDHIWIVEPEDLSHLIIEDGKDYCTLITCTPYGINTHRLLVRGHRIDNLDGSAMVVADAIQIRPIFIAPFLAIPLLVILLLYVLISTSARNMKKRDLKEEYMHENGLQEAEIEVEGQDDIIDAVKEFVGKKREH